MTTEIDLRDATEERHHERLYDALDDADRGDELCVVAGRDLDRDLVRYQIERDRAVTWAYDHPDAEPRELRVTAGEPLDGAFGTVDVRDLKPQRRHRELLEIFDELEAGEGFVLVNDHDPKPLYHELESTHGDVVGWEYRRRDADEWRVEVVKTGDTEAADGDVVTRYDVRRIPKPERHPTIHHRYGMIPEGGTMEIVAPHEPRPLRREFRQQYGDGFEWEVLESEPGRCRVHITKAESAADADVGGRGRCAPAESEVAAAPSDGGSIEVTEELDVRELAPAQRHERIFDAYEALNAGEGFVLVNDHDPKPLSHQFQAEAGPAFRWEYRARDHGEFRVLIGKAETTDGDGTLDQGTEAPF